MILKTQIGHSDCKICKILKLNEWVQAHCSIPFHFFASPGLCGSAVFSSSCRPVEQCCSVYWTQDEAITSFQLGAGIWAQQEWNLLSWKASFIYLFIVCVYIYVTRIANIGGLPYIILRGCVRVSWLWGLMFYDVPFGACCLMRADTWRFLNLRTRFREELPIFPSPSWIFSWNSVKTNRLFIIVSLWHPFLYYGMAGLNCQSGYL